MRPSFTGLATVTRLISAFVFLFAGLAGARAANVPAAAELPDLYSLVQEIGAVREDEQKAVPIDPAIVRPVADWLFAMRGDTQRLAGIRQGQAHLVVPDRDREDYCKKINDGLRDSGSEVKVLIRYDVAQARMLIDAIAPDLTALMGRLPELSAPEDAFVVLSKQLDQRFQDNINAHILQVITKHPGALSYLKREFNLSEDSSSLERAATLLSLEEIADHRWCDQQPRVVQYPDLAAARAIAVRWLESALIPISEASFQETLRKLLEDAATGSAANVTVPGAEIIANPSAPVACPPERDICWSAVLDFEATVHQTEGRVRVLLRRHLKPIGGAPAPMTASASYLPTGITIENVSIVPADAGKGQRFQINTHPFLPTQPSIDMDALWLGLSALDLPAGVAVTAATVALKPDFSEVGINLTVGIPALGVRRSVYWRLIGAPQVVGGTLTDTVKKTIDAIPQRVITDATARLADMQIKLAIPGYEQPIVLGKVAIDEVLEQKIAFSAELELPPFGNVRGKFQFEARSSQLNVEVKSIAFPIASVHAFQAGVRRVADEIAPGAGDCVAIAGIDLTSTGIGQAQIRLRIGDGQLDVTDMKLASLAPAIAQTAGLNLSNCLADRARQLAQAQIDDALRRMKGQSIAMFGMTATVIDARVKRAGDGVRFSTDLMIDTGTTKIRLSNVLINGNWALGNPLRLADIDLTTVTLQNPDDIAAILNAAAPGLPRIASSLNIERIAWRASGPVIACSFTIKGLRNPVHLENLTLDVSQAQEAIRASLNAAATAFLTREANGLLKSALTDLGPIQSIAIASPTDLLPQNGPAQLTVDVTADVGRGIVVPMKVTLLPTFDITVNRNKALESAVIGFANGFLGGVLNVTGSPISDLKAVIDVDRRKYGIRFDLKFDVLGGILKDFRADNFVITNRGVEVPEAFGLPIPDLPITIGPVQIIVNSGKLYTRPPGQFELGADTVFSADPTGLIVLLRSTMRANAAAKRLEANGNLLALRIPFLKFNGTLDFEDIRLDATARTVDPLARIVNLNSKLFVDARTGNADMNSNVKVLGLDLSKVDIKLQQLGHPGASVIARVGTNIAVASANLALQSRLDFSHARADGNLTFIDSRLGSGSLSITPAVLDTSFRVFGIGVRLVVPSVSRLNSQLIEQIIRRLLDFHPSFDFKKAQITIVLVDSSGKHVEATVGGGAANAPQSQAEQRAAEPQERRGGVEVTGGGGDGTVLNDPVSPDLAQDLCRDSQDGHWRYIRGLDKKHAMELDHRDRAKTNTVYFHSGSRIASEETLIRLREVAAGQATILACFEMHPLAQTIKWYFEKHKTNIQSEKVAVIARNSPPILEAIVFQYDKNPVALPLLMGRDNAVFDAAIADAQRGGWKTTPIAPSILAFLAAQAVKLERSIEVDRVISLNIESLPSAWRERRLAVLRDVAIAGSPRMIVVSDMPLQTSRRSRPARPLSAFLRRAVLPEGKSLNVDVAVTLDRKNPIYKLAQANPALVDRVIAAAEAQDFQPEILSPTEPIASACVLVRAMVGEAIQLVAVKEDQVGYLTLEEAGTGAIQWRREAAALQPLCERVLESKNGVAFLNRDNVGNREWLAVHTLSLSEDGHVYLFGWEGTVKDVGVRQASIVDIRKSLESWARTQSVRTEDVADRDFVKLDTASRKRDLLRDLVSALGTSERFRANARGLVRP